MTSETNRQLARTFMQLLTDGHIEQAADCLTEDLHWRIISTSRPDVYRRTQVISAIKVMIAASTDDKVAIEAESLVNLKSGKTYNNKYRCGTTRRPQISSSRTSVSREIRTWC
jgi:hypothetical protein